MGSNILPGQQRVNNGRERARLVAAVASRGLHDEEEES
jgi:hypothetical protein